MRWRARLGTAVSFCCITAFAGALAAAELGPRPSYRVERATGPIRVDGVLDETAWESAVEIPLTHEWFPDDNAAPPVETVCRLTFDDETLYVAFQALDPEPERIRARWAARDEPFQDDTVGFLIDTFDDRRRAFQFRVNPLGVQMDGLTSDVDGSEDWSWDAIWESAGRITGEGYVVEVAIPLRQLRFPRADADGADGGAQSWGFLALRDYPRSVRHRLRSTRNDRDLNCFVCQVHPVVGFRPVESGHHLELDPTVTVSRADTIAPDGRAGDPLRSGDEDADAGLTLSWAPTPSLTVNGALNPDFSQVEADATQLAVNERFALFFPEKRPFFLENIDLFGTPLPAVFTRTIADPSVGLKVTGKEGPHAFGALAAEDRINNLIFPGNQGSSQTTLDRDVRSAVARYRRDVGETSTLGVLYTGREGDGYGNHVAGLDGVVRPTDADVVRFQVLGSRTEYPDELARDFGQPLGTFDGTAYSLSYGHATRNWHWGGGYRDLDPDFRADAGFLPRVDLKTGNFGVERTFWGSEERWFRRIEIFAGADTSRDHSGEIEEWGADLVVSWEGPRQTYLQASLAPNDEYYDGVNYDNFRQSVYLLTRPSGAVSFELDVDWGETIDFAGSRQADFVSLEPRLELRLGRRVSAEIAHVWQDFEVDAGDLFTARLTRLRLFYHLSRRAYFRAILQHRDVERNVAVYRDPVEPNAEELLSQLLFSYEVNPRTVLLLGYSDDREREPAVEFGRRDGLEPTGRAFFLKIGYALLL